MRIQHALVCIAVVLAVSTSATFASPCSQEIDRVQSGIDAKLEAQAAAGRSARESTSATTHRQPTPGSIAAAEAELGRHIVRTAASSPGANDRGPRGRPCGEPECL
jgi:GTP cyclohydrolase FolE2